MDDIGQRRLGQPAGKDRQAAVWGDKCAH
jgi:hypothetical protein